VDSLPFNLQVQVTQWKALTADMQKVTFPFEEPSLAFFSMVHTRTEGTRVDIDVLYGNTIEVNIYADACDIRNLPAQYYCFRGVRCEIPLPKRANFGSFWRQTTTDSPYLGTGAEPLRIVIRGFDSAFNIRQVRGQALCNSLTSQNAPFCSTNKDATSVYYWGEDNGDWYPSKDRNALEFYQNLTQAFTCPVPDDCDCIAQTQQCRDALQAYACQFMFNPCDGNYFERQPTYRTCRNVEYYCGRTWRCAGIPRLSCDHSFYTYGISQVNANDLPLNSLDEPPGDTGASRRAGIIALIVILCVLGAIALATIGYILYQRSSSLSSVVFDESRLGEYEAM